jgi:hypothetical protein
VDKGAIRRRLALGVAMLTTSGLLALAGPGTGAAEAAALCSGRKVRILSFSTGSVQIYKSRGYVCAVTLPKKPGVRQHMSVSVRARGGRAAPDSGLFTRHAGPKTVHAGHRCVWVTGSVGSRGASSGWILC